MCRWRFKRIIRTICFSFCQVSDTLQLWNLERISDKGWKFVKAMTKDLSDWGEDVCKLCICSFVISQSNTSWGRYSRRLENYERRILWRSSDLPRNVYNLDWSCNTMQYYKAFSLCRHSPHLRWSAKLDALYGWSKGHGKNNA